MYLINTISNRDIALLYHYRILRTPADFLSAAYCDDEPIISEIKKGIATDLQTETGLQIFSYDLGVDLDPNLIPYLEFDSESAYDAKKLQDLLYLDNSTIYGTVSEFSEPVLVHIYQVESLNSISHSIDQYLAAIGKLDIDDLNARFDSKKQSNGMSSISGLGDNLVEFYQNKEKLELKDAGYTITSALCSQLLVNPSQELLMSLPRKLKNNINISVTDGETRYLEAFSGYTINIKGDGKWIIRDCDCGIDFVSGSGEVYLWNCKLVHFRNSIISGDSNSYSCRYLYSHRSLVVINQGEIIEIAIVGGSTFIDSPESIGDTKIKKISVIGSGCSAYSWSGILPVDSTNILGLAWWLDSETNSSYLYVAGRRIDEASGEHDAELNPSNIIEYNVDNIRISQGDE